MNISAIILAAGIGKRAELEFNKVLYKINNKIVLDYSVDSFQKQTQIEEIILVVNRNEYEYFSKLYEGSLLKVIVGGKERQDSVYNAINISKNDFVIIHDGARPYIPEDSLRNMIKTLEKEDSITLGVKVKNTIQEVKGDHVVKTLNRDSLIITQTPQAFKKDLLLEAHKKAIEDNFYGTDDTMLLEKYLGVYAFVVQGDYRNIKLTTPEDIKLLEVIL